MLRRSLFASALMLLGTVGFAGVASAETATVTFNGSVPGACSFNSATASGSLQQWDVNGDGNQNDGLIAWPGYGGTMANISLTCTGAGSLSMGDVVPDASNPASTYAYGGVFDQYGNYLTYNGGSTSISAGSTVPLQVGMHAYNQSYGTPLPSGNYKYSVTLTATGN